MFKLICMMKTRSMTKTRRKMMSDFSIGINLEVYEEGVLTRILKSNALSDETIHMIMEDIAQTLNEEDNDE
jgi:hypothetical protein